MKRTHTKMYKMEHYLGIDFSTEQSTEISKKGIKEVINYLEKELLEWENEVKIKNTPIIGKITIEYATDNEWKNINKIRNENNKINTLIEIQTEWEEELKKNPNIKYSEMLKKYIK